MKLYLDACCFNRPFDDQRQARVHLEAEAVLSIIGRAQTHGWRCVSSEALEFEIARTPDPHRRQRVRGLLRSSTAGEPLILVDGELETRAAELGHVGFRPLDALHIAGAERVTADALLTTDDRLLRLAKRLPTGQGPRVLIANPLGWLTEQLVAGENGRHDA